MSVYYIVYIEVHRNIDVMVGICLHNISTENIQQYENAYAVKCNNVFSCLMEQNSFRAIDNMSCTNYVSCPLLY